MPEHKMIDADALCAGYLASTQALMGRILAEERDGLDEAAAKLADQIEADRLVYIYGPGGHSNLATQEVFFRAGGLMHFSAILDEGTLLSSGALRSMAIERTPGYGKVVIANQRLGEGDLLILVNAYGINAALIDAALEAKRAGYSSSASARASMPQTPRRTIRRGIRPSIICMISLTWPSTPKCRWAMRWCAWRAWASRLRPFSTFANAFALNCLVIRTIAKLVDRGIEPPVWRSGNAPGGDEANGRFIARFHDRVRAL